MKKHIKVQTVIFAFILFSLTITITACSNSNTEKRLNLRKIEKQIEAGNYLDAYDQLRSADQEVNKKQADKIKLLMEQCKTELLTPYESILKKDENDEMGTYYYIAPKELGHFALYIGQSKMDPETILLHIYCLGNFERNKDTSILYTNWLHIKGDSDEVFSISVSPFQDGERRFVGSTQLEMIDHILSKSDADSIMKIIENTNTLKVRMSDEDRYDRNHIDIVATNSELQNIKTVLEYYQLLYHIYK